MLAHSRWLYPGFDRVWLSLCHFREREQIEIFNRNSCSTVSVFDITKDVSVWVGVVTWVWLRGCVWVFGCEWGCNMGREQSIMVIV